ncbi:TPA: restriction endonuclease subunit S [Haemophilus influenzae]
MSKLGNYISVQNGYAFKSKDFIKNLSGMPVIKIGNVTGGSFIDLSSYDTISEEIARKVKSFQTKDDDILIAMTGANVGKVSRIAKGTQPCLINQRVGRFILKEDCPYSSDFIYYLVSSNKSFQYFSSTADGAAQPNISGKLIEDLEFPDISPKSANKAGKHLKVLDEKIQLNTQINTQINQTLEQIAQALFKSWFVDFDPVRAKVQALSDGLSLEQAELAAMQAISGKTPEELTALSQTQPDRYAELAETAKAFPCEMVEVDGVEVPKGWEVTPLSGLFTLISGTQIPKEEHIYEAKEGYERFIQKRLFKQQSYNLCRNIKKNKRCTEKDILIDRYGDAGKIRFGISGVYNIALAKIALNDNNLIEYLRWFLMQPKQHILSRPLELQLEHL